MNEIELPADFVDKIISSSSISYSSLAEDIEENLRLEMKRCESCRISRGYKERPYELKEFKTGEFCIYHSRVKDKDRTKNFGRPNWIGKK